MSTQWILLLRNTVSLRDAVLLVAGLPVSPLAVPATIDRQAAAST